jgi:hypothetical protein
VLGFDDLDLIEQALSNVPDADSDEADDERYWVIIGELHRRGSAAIFQRCATCATGDDPVAQRFACDVLGQLGYERGTPFGDESLSLLLSLCGAERPVEVTRASIAALGHLGRVEALPEVVACAQHRDESVRLATAIALPSLDGKGWVTSAHPVAATLMRLTCDLSPDVRDWATFGLGTQLMVDGDDVRRCLATRLDDTDDDTRAEALVGLARRHEPGIDRRVREALEAETVSTLAIDAAAMLGDPQFADVLAAIGRRWNADDPHLQRAVRRCEPSRLSGEIERVTALLDAASVARTSVAVSTDLLCHDVAAQVVMVDGGSSSRFSLEALLSRAGGSIDAAIRLIQLEVAASADSEG